MSSPRLFVRPLVIVALLLAAAKVQDSPAAEHLAGGSHGIQGRAFFKRPSTGERMKAGESHAMQATGASASAFRRMMPNGSGFPNSVLFLADDSAVDQYPGYPPFDVAVGDFNGDGTAELAVAVQCSDFDTCSDFPLNAGVASLTTTVLSVGTHSLVAIYSGDAFSQKSKSPVLHQVVNKVATTTVVTSSLNPSTYGQPVTLTATVSAAGPAPTDTVTFKNGSTSLGTGTLVGGVAKITKSTLPSGTLPITASYNGNTASAKSTSPTLTQVVNKATSTTTITSSVNPCTVGQAVKFTATVKSPTVVPVGTVTFTVGTTTLGQVSLAGGKASLTTSVLPKGTTTVTATYNGTSNITGSSVSAVQTVK
jgi:hypothetical protein